MADLYEEIKDDIKQERFLQLWSRIKWYVIGGALGILFGTGSTTFFKEFYLGKKWRLGTELYHMSEAVDLEDKRWEPLYSSEHDAVRSLALLKKAGFYLVAEEYENAVSIYERVSSDEKAPTEFRDFARLMLLYMEKDVAEGKQLPEKVWGAAVQEHELTALLDKGDKEAASVKVEEILSRKDVPLGIRQRLEQVQLTFPVKKDQLLSEDVDGVQQ